MITSLILTTYLIYFYVLILRYIYEFNAIYNDLVDQYDMPILWVICEYMIWAYIICMKIIWWIKWYFFFNIYIIYIYIYIYINYCRILIVSFLLVNMSCDMAVYIYIYITPLPLKYSNRILIVAWKKQGVILYHLYYIVYQFLILCNDFYLLHIQLNFPPLSVENDHRIHSVPCMLVNISCA